MSADARRTAGEPYSGFGEPAGDELRELGYYVKLLMADVQEARSDLQHSRTQLAHADKLAAVGKLAASVAHEIRNPLTSMKMWLYSLRRTAGGSEERQQKLDMISEEIVRLDNIVRHFLEFSRPAELKLSVLTIGSLLDKTIELVHHHLNEHKIRVTRDDEQRLPEIRADTEQIRQVLLNLIINAIEAMPRGGELRISTSQSRRGEGDMVKVRIADTGPGISREVQDRMFEPFFTTKAEGTGLGLCIAASIMARHGGALVLESSNAHGTQWAIWIPIVRSRQNV
jgi:signal transduction histidine kinase